jgi:hypothetical protein
MDDASADTEWVPVLVLDSGVTVQQRGRNRDIYQRLRNGVPEEERCGLRGGPLHHMVFEIPVGSVSFGPYGTISFRLDPDGDCFRRLLSCITDALPLRCAADDEVAALKAEIARLKAERT